MKALSAIVASSLVFALALTGCGKQEETPIVDENLDNSVVEQDNFVNPDDTIGNVDEENDIILDDTLVNDEDNTLVNDGVETDNAVLENDENTDNIVG